VAPKAAPKTTAVVPGGVEVLENCRKLLRYALTESLAIPDELRRDIAVVDQTLSALSIPPLLASTATPPGQTGGDFVEELLKVHNGLLKVVAPATLAGIEFMDRWPGVVRLAMFLAVVSAVIVLLTTLQTVVVASSSQAHGGSPTLTSDSGVADSGAQLAEAGMP
jgi:hypothetical protein